MYKSPPESLVTNAASALFNDLISAVGSSAALTIMRNNHPFFQKKVYGLVLATPETNDWALRLRHHFGMEFSSLYPQLDLELETIFVKGGHGEMQAALVNHPLLVGKDSGRFSFVLTPGYAEAMVFDEVRFMLQSTLPQIYCVPGSLTAPFSKMREHFAGVHNAMMHPAEYIDALSALLPTIKTVGIAYTSYVEHRDENDHVQRQFRMLSEAFSRAGIEVVKHLWDAQDSNEYDLKRTLQVVDAFVTLDEMAVPVHREKLIALCNAYRTPLCASELDSVFAGAALGCGITRETFAKPMLRVLHTMMFPRNRLVSSVEIPMQKGMRYNMNGMVAQGVVISDKSAALMRMKSVYDLDIISL